MKPTASQRKKVWFIAHADVEHFRPSKADDITRVLDRHVTPTAVYHFSMKENQAVVTADDVVVEVIDVVEGATGKLRVLRAFMDALERFRDDEFPGLKARATAANFLDNVALILPSRIVNEDLGDFLEDINRRASQGQSPLKIYVRTAAATFWLMVNTVDYLARAIGARKSA